VSLKELKCPMCKGTLWLDLSTGKVVDHRSADHQKADFGEFLKARESRGDIWEQKLKKAKEDEAKRKAERDEKFKQAKEHPESLEGDVPTIQWD
jgi:hypothetical protein